MKRTDFLFAMPSFVRGMGKCLDIGSTSSKIFNTSNSETEADINALSSDWNLVGNDMRKALNEYGKEYKERTTRAI